MKIFRSSGLLVLFAVGAMACGSSGGGGGGAGGSGTTSAGGQAQVLGTACPAPEQDCCNAWAKDCLAEGGYLDTCMFGLNCATAQYNIGVNSICHPVQTPAAGQFACAYLACDVGQVCYYQKLAGDGCESHACVAAPTPCDQTPTCECFMANGLLSGPGAGCTGDSSGNATVTGNSASWP